ncbi:MAG: stage III sporulation protein AB [Ruminococcus sp.]|nr:stage III sporulation protein AB [Ruminococcus sp.]
MIRLLTSLVLTAFGGTIGFALSDKLKNDRKTSQTILALLQRISFLISYRCDDVYKVWTEIRSDNEFSRLGFLKNLPTEQFPENDLRSCWMSAVKSEHYPEWEEEVLLRLCSVLGKSDSESQRSEISELIAEMERFSVRQDELYYKKCRIYRTAGLLFGAMVGILVI